MNTRMRSMRSTKCIININISSEIELLCSYYLDQCVSNEIQFNQAIEPDIYIKAEPKLLRTAISNVLDNAFKFTKRGTISVSISQNVVDTHGFAVIKISDTGIGISPQNLEYIFQDFRQSSEGLNRSHEGLGLGLAISSRIIRLFNGTISAVSELNSGTEISISLPLSDGLLAIEEKAQMNEITEHDYGDENGNLPCILSVEDNIVNQKLIESFLQDICKVDSVMNANEAFKKVTKKQYKAILMDINLGPSMDGLEAAKRIKQLENYSNVPIIAVTGYAMVGDKGKMIEEGCDFYISKPFDQQTIISLIEAIVQ